jgi:alkylation response protein AidB-like acyl-CoA dehydrogenase
MTAYEPPVKDYDFLLRNVIAADEVLSAVTAGDVSVDDAMDVVEGAASVVRPIAELSAIGDRIGSRLKDGTVVTPPGFREAFASYAEGGWIGLAAPESIGGAGMPRTIAIASDEFLSAANTAFAMAPQLNSYALAVFAAVNDSELNAIYVPAMIAGRWTATMELTEPQAGTDVSAIRTVAKPQDDGTWLLSGQKMFISWGDHDLAENIIHLVLARTPGAPVGLAGLSLFVVPKLLPRPDGSVGERNAIQCVSLEHKLGIHASPTCLIDYDGATGFLIGEPHRGLQAMFVMMNAARLGTGVQGLAVAERAYQAATAYAAERVQGQVIGRELDTPIAEHPDVRRLLLSMGSGVSAMRALAVQTAAWLDLSTSEQASTAKSAAALAQLFLPVVKAWLTETGLQITSDAIQVHGGMGYVEETGVAQLLRDARIFPIYEGTTAVQANHLVSRIVSRDRGQSALAALELMSETCRELGELDHQVAVRIASRLESGVALLRQATLDLLDRGERPRDVFAAAVPYLNMWGLLAGGWMHGRILRAVLKGADTSRERRIVEADFYGVHYLSRLAGLADVVAAGETVLT